MPDDKDKPSVKTDEPDEEAGGFLVRKCFEGEGFKLDRNIEIRVSKIAGTAVYLAVRAPRNMRIRRADKS